MLNSPYPRSVNHSCVSNSPGDSSLARFKFLWFSDLVTPWRVAFKIQKGSLRSKWKENAGQWVTGTARNSSRSQPQSSWFPATFFWWHILQGKILHNLLSSDYRECYNFAIKQCTEHAQIRTANSRQSIQGFTWLGWCCCCFGWCGHNVNIMAVSMSLL